MNDTGAKRGARGKAHTGRPLEALPAGTVSAPRGRWLFLTGTAVVLAGLLGYGLFEARQEHQAEQERKAAGAEKRVRGEQTWSIEELTYRHVQGDVAYRVNPPVGGDHSTVWMNCDGDVYTDAVRKENAVHSLEHGAVWITYNTQAEATSVRALADKVASTPYTLMSPVSTQPGRIMLTAWGHQLTVDTARDPRVGEFLAAYVQGPQTPEPGAPCTGGRAAP
ncbi:DUF3105 domain-containing protein [Streptomyces sp. NPDC006235]|uniref:DUF3105 domain-containing protein n=1 Tax=Streptomyces sp. NPDC006235 TaxID=3156736 RepID=UPI0033BE6213